MERIEKRILNLLQEIEGVPVKDTAGIITARALMPASREKHLLNALRLSDRR